MIEYKITDLSLRGEGIADGQVYAPMTLPGETVTGHLTGNRLSDVKVLVPSSDRVAAPCAHFRSCGGCKMQHASEMFIGNWKTDLIKSALSAHGLECDIRPIVTSPPRSRRRATFSARRTKKDALAGFHTGSSDVIISIPDCQLITSKLRSALPVCEDLARQTASRKAELTIAVTQSNAGLDLSVTGGKPLDEALRITLAKLAATHDVARLSWGREVIVIRNRPVQSFDGIEVVPPDGAFLQATKDAEQFLQKQVAGIVTAAKSAVDLFSGCGTFALPLSLSHIIHAVEANSAMLETINAAWRNTTGVKNLSVELRDLFRNPLLSDEFNRFDAAVVNPPRAGAQAQVAELARSTVPVIAYVSCNPISFARDAKHLVAKGYNLNWVQPLDQFRWSTHVELVAAFNRP